MQTLNASTDVTWTNVNITGVGTSITGSAPYSPGDFDFSVGTIDINGGVFTDLGTWTFNTNSTINDATFRRCESITSSSAAFVDNLFDSANDTEAVVVANLNELTTNHFIIDATNGGHAVELTGAAGTYTWNNTLSGYDTGSSGTNVGVEGGSITGDEAIHVTATTGTITINVSAGATVPSVSSAGAQVDVSASVDVTITVKDKADDSAISGAQTSVFLRDSPYTQIMNEDTNASGIATESYSGSTPVDVVIKVRKSDDLDDPRYFGYSKVDTISTSGLTLGVSLEQNPFI